jgi:hypothetical protein
MEIFFQYLNTIYLIRQRNCSCHYNAILHSDEAKRGFGLMTEIYMIVRSSLTTNHRSNSKTINLMRKELAERNAIQSSSHPLIATISWLQVEESGKKKSMKEFHKNQLFIWNLQ